MLKRINKELKDFFEKKYIINKKEYKYKVVDFFYNLSITMYIVNDLINTYHLLITNIVTNKTILDILIPQEYPFKPFSIQDYSFSKSNCNNINYLKYLGNTSKLFDSYDNTIMSFFYSIQYGKPKFLNLNKCSCFCCSSITCAYNWSPACRINNILLEYLEIDFITNYCKKYNYKKITHIYNKLFELYFNKLPNEVIDIIFGFLY